MKKIAVLLALFFWVLPYTHLDAAVIWESEFYQFRYAVDENGGLFIYPPAFYLIPSHQDTDVHHYDPGNSLFADYDAIAAGNVVEFTSFPGEIQLNAMAKGPEAGVNPPNGLLVQAFAEIVPNGLDESYGVDIGQRVRSWISRRFTVDQDGWYAIDTYLNGLVTFDAFNNGPTYHATYSIKGTVSLEELVIVGGQVLDISAVAGFPLDLDEATRNQQIEVPLVVENEQQQSVTYQLKVNLALESDLINFAQSSSTILGAISGSYQLATEDNPFELGASLSEGEPRDTDGDGVSNQLDNCPDHPNPDQTDSDGDEIGDACDDDDDNDGVNDDQDAFPLDPEESADFDGDGIGDNADSDDDNDGVQDDQDQFPFDPNEWSDSDGDGIGDNADTDADNDEMPDVWEELYGLDPLVDDSAEDADGDGWTNLIEYQRDTDPTDPDSHPNSIIPCLSLLLGDEPDSADPGCVELIADNCNLSAPSLFSESIDTDEHGFIWVNFTWSAVECAYQYYIRIGTVPNLTDLALGEPGFSEIPVDSTSLVANFSEAAQGIYYWAVTAGCENFHERGDWSEIKSFNFPPPTP